MGTRFQKFRNRTYDNVGPDGIGGNNGLQWTVEVLEQMYTDPEYPREIAPALPVFLKESGKSRADLWALGSILAVEYAIETNNMVCDGTFNDNPTWQCNEDKGSADCRVRHR